MNNKPVAAQRTITQNRILMITNPQLHDEP